MQYPNIDPVALSIGPVQLHWYGLMYVFAFAVGWLLGRWRASRPWSGWKSEQVDDYVTWVMLGVILGGRLGYALFYDLAAYLSDPLEIFRLWNGGMSFHGGLIGVIAASWLWGRRRGKTLVEILDFVAPLVPTGILFGRIGNFRDLVQGFEHTHGAVHRVGHDIGEVGKEVERGKNHTDVAKIRRQLTIGHSVAHNLQPAESPDRLRGHTDQKADDGEDGESDEVALEVGLI